MLLFSFCFVLCYNKMYKEYKVNVNKLYIYTIFMVNQI